MEAIEKLNKFHEAYADGAVCYRKPSADALRRLEKRAPAELCQYWGVHGWCSFRGGLLWMVNPDDYVDVQQDWPLDGDALVIARSAFGDLLAIVERKLFIMFVHTGRYLLSPSTYEDFLPYHLTQAERLEGFFWGDFYREAVAKVGAPTQDEILTFEPALALGGEPKLDNVRRVSLKPALAILAQVRPELRSF